MEILIDNRQTRIEADWGELGKKAERILGQLGCSHSAVLSIALVHSDEMADLNLKYRGKQSPTNVLSFSQLEGPASEFRVELLGDVVLCTDVAADDAVALGYSNDEMLVYLLIHGILHVVGYDHSLPQDESAMSSKLEEIFQEFFPRDTEPASFSQNPSQLR
ncbi:MAG: rRNA maturation RNase YbeY [Desulfomonile sp.]|jgi:probable rRNA maturation factor